MTKLEIPTIEKARQMTIGELSKTFNISAYHAGNLESALKPEYFPIITYHELKIKEMEEITGLSEKDIIYFRFALIKAKLDTRKKRVKRRRRKGTVLSEARFLNFISGKPSTYKEIREGIGKTQRQVYELTRFLKEKRKVRTVKISLGRTRVKQTFSPYEVVGKLTNKTVAYLPWEETLLGKKIIPYLPKELPVNMRRALSRRFSRFLPRGAFKVVYDFMCEHGVR